MQSRRIISLGGSTVTSRRVPSLLSLIHICFDTLYNPDGTVAWQYPKPAPEDPDQTWAVKDPYVQEHIRLVTAIRNNEPLNDAETPVQSVLMAIMGRMAAYTGKSVTWDELIASDLKDVYKRQRQPRTRTPRSVPTPFGESPFGGTNHTRTIKIQVQIKRTKPFYPGLKA